MADHVRDSAHLSPPLESVSPRGVPPFDAVIFGMDGVVPGTGVFAGTVELVRRLRAGGVPVGLATASRGAQALPGSARLQALFDVVVDGTVAETMGLPGKPDPALLLEVLRRLGVPPQRAAVVEHAALGVQAGRRAGLRLVVGIAGGGDRAALRAAGADVVLDDLSQLDLGVVRADPWVLTYEGFDPAHEGHREALTALGNGYLGTRGAAPESRADVVHYGCRSTWASTGDGGRLASFPPPGSGANWTCGGRC